MKLMLIYRKCIQSPFFTHPKNKKCFYLSSWCFFSETCHIHKKKFRTGKYNSLCSCDYMAVDTGFTHCRIISPHCRKSECSIDSNKV